MQLDTLRNVHLTYCTNIHSGESLADLTTVVTRDVSAVKALICPDKVMGVGLRVSARAARELLEPGELSDFAQLLGELGLYVFTINGFPYGNFHGTPVKAGVYEPDWTTEERVQYTKDLILILATLLPVGQLGSISTIPGCFRPKVTRFTSTKIADALLEIAAELWRLHQTAGQEICLALEPEPHCMLETTEEAVTFFESQLLSQKSIEQFQKLTGVSASESRAALLRYLGVCLDACHTAVEFEDPAQSIERLKTSGVRVAKLQLSCGLAVPVFNAAAAQQLRVFSDEIYLHQSVVRDETGVRKYLDLPEALAIEQAIEAAGQTVSVLRSDETLDANAAVSAEWRIHFHVPIFLEELGSFRSTQSSLSKLLQIELSEPYTTHLEVETYTWDVLPAEFRKTSIHMAIAREMHWVLHELGQNDALSLD